MVQIVGKYEHVSNAPNFESYLKALGVPEAVIPGVLAQKSTLTISENNGQWTFHYSDAGKEWSSTFNLGEPYDEQMFNGDFLKSVAKREGDKLILETMVRDAKDNRVYEFNDTGLTVVSINVEYSLSISYYLPSEQSEMSRIDQQCLQEGLEGFLVVQL